METPKKRNEIVEVLNTPPIFSPSGSDSEENYWLMNHEERKVKRLKLEGEATTKSEVGEPKLWDLSPGWRKYTIKMRVSSIKMHAYKRDPKMWLLKFTGVDESGEIPVSAFHPVSLKFRESLKVNKAYEITNVSVRENESSFTSMTGFPHQVRLNEDSVISPLCPDDLPPLNLNLKKKIADLRKAEVKSNGELVDLVAIVCINDGLETNQMGGKYRKLYVTDDSFETLSFYLNGWEAINFGEEEEFPVILRKFRMGELKQKHVLKTTELSAIIRDVRNFPEATALFETFREAKAMRSQSSQRSSTEEGDCSQPSIVDETSFESKEESSIDDLRSLSQPTD